ncbi:hypothetical protein COSO111634_08380 [Corallococcus soli]
MKPLGPNASRKRSSVSGRMGSAPVKATSQRLRSTACRSSGVLLRTHRSKAKLGPPLMVPPKRLTASIHAMGRLRKLRGDISAAL